jgi:hypothetical protein
VSLKKDSRLLSIVKTYPLPTSAFDENANKAVGAMETKAPRREHFRYDKKKEAKPKVHSHQYNDLSLTNSSETN